MLNVTVLEGEAKPSKPQNTQWESKNHTIDSENENSEKPENNQWESKNRTSDSEEHKKPTFNAVDFTRPSPKKPESKPEYGGNHMHNKN